MSLTAEQIRARYAPTMTAPVPLTDPGTRPIPVVTIEQVCRPVTEQVTIRPLARTGMYLDRADRAGAEDMDMPGTVTADLAQDDTAFGPVALRDYVARQIETRFGLSPRAEDYKEMAIFTRFCKRYDDLALEENHGQAWALPIARHAFIDKGGYWKGAPVSMTRFCRGSDPYFGDLIRAYLYNIAMQCRHRV